MPYELRGERRSDASSDANLVAELLRGSVSQLGDFTVRPADAPLSTGRSGDATRHQRGTELVLEVDGISVPLVARSHRRVMGGTHLHVSVFAPDSQRPRQPPVSMQTNERQMLGDDDLRGVLSMLGLAFEKAGVLVGSLQNTPAQVASLRALESWRSEGLNGVVSDIIDPGARAFATRAMLELERALPDVLGKYARVTAIDEVRVGIVNYVGLRFVVGDKVLRAEYLTGPKVPPTATITSLDGSRRSGSYHVSGSDMRKRSGGPDARSLLT